MTDSGLKLYHFKIIGNEHVARVIVSVGKAVEQYRRTDEGVVFLVQGHSADGGYHIHHLAVAIHVEHPVVAFFKHMLHYHSHHPYHSEHVVGMGMCNEEVMDIVDCHSCRRQLTQNTVSTTGINHQSHRLTFMLYVVYSLLHLLVHIGFSEL